MGGQDDYRTIYGKFTDEELKKAFLDKVDAALWSHGHSGYSGTIAEANTSYFYIFDKVFKDPEEAEDFLKENEGCQTRNSFSHKNYTNCARFKNEDEEGAVFGGVYSY